MRVTTKRRLRISVLLMVTVLVALVAGSAVALAYEPGGGGKGSLVITKCITGDSYGKQTDDFYVRVTGPNGYNVHDNFGETSHTLKLDNLTPGQYTVTEDTPGYPFSVIGGGPVNVAAYQQASMTITNNGSTTTTEGKGCLKIYKCITGDNPNHLSAKDFCVKVTGPNNYSWEGNFGQDGKIELSNLKPGTYCVNENGPVYPFTASGEGDVAVQPNDTTRVTITNNGSTTTTECKGTLKIYKCITGDNPYGQGYDDFCVKVTGPNGYCWEGEFGENGEICLTDLKPGTYCVDEKGPNYPFTAYGEGNVSVQGNKTTKVTIQNSGSTTSTTKATGCLVVEKCITGDNPECLKYEDFCVEVIGPLPCTDVVFSGHFNEEGKVILAGLAPGKYKVTEKDPGYPWKVTGEGVVEVCANQTAKTEIVNCGSTTSTTCKVTSTTVLGWVVQPEIIQTGGGGTAGGNGALIVLVLAGTMLASVLVASGLGVRAGIL